CNASTVLYHQAIELCIPVFSGVAGLPETPLVVSGATIVGFVVIKTGCYRWSLWQGWALTALGSGILLLMKPGHSRPATDLSASAHCLWHRNADPSHDTLDASSMGARAQCRCCRLRLLHPQSQSGRRRGG
ncbi:hypothetical protein BD289DRAFT_494821, partial [Coniella lustricola]